MVLSVVGGLAVLASLNVAEVAHVADLVMRTRMDLSVGVIVGTSSHAAVGQVAPLVDVEPVKARGQAGEVGLDANLLAFLLSELNGAGHT